ncbi:MAG: anthranilate synthase component I family protein, partial [Egicoccus sp.]
PARPPALRTSLDHDRHLARVADVLERIAAGDVFQVNLTQRLTSHWEHDAAALYRALRRESPATFGAVLPAIGVASVSPETFLAVAGRQVTTRPIKGTRPRHPAPDLDAALADDLSTSAKDRAENVMVVDLERNDLGRVCRSGSVRVPELAAVEAHPTVWHLVSTVTGELRPEVGYGELLRATFPCGSITGAPKIAAMQIIERLETVRRGWYCGAVGFLSPGAASLSVAIRTATLQADGTVDYGAGGGIVADSDPADERRESFDKAAAFLRAVGIPRERVR